MTTTNGEGKMGKCKTCGGSKHVPSKPCLSDAVPCPTCSAPTPSSVPGEAGPCESNFQNANVVLHGEKSSEETGPYYFWLTEKFGGAHLMGPGIADFPVEVWYTPDNLVALGNKAHAQGRVSLLEIIKIQENDIHDLGLRLEESENRGRGLCAEAIQNEASLTAELEAKDKESAETVNTAVNLCNEVRKREVAGLSAKLEAARAENETLKLEVLTCVRVVEFLKNEFLEALRLLEHYGPRLPDHHCGPENNCDSFCQEAQTFVTKTNDWERMISAISKDIKSAALTPKENWDIHAPSPENLKEIKKSVDAMDAGTLKRFKLEENGK